MLALPVGITGDYAPKTTPAEARPWLPYPTRERNQWMGLPVLRELERWAEEDRQDMATSNGKYSISEDAKEGDVPRRGVPERGLLLVDYPSVEDQGRRTNEEERLLIEALHGSLKLRWPEVTRTRRRPSSEAKRSPLKIHIPGTACRDCKGVGSLSSSPGREKAGIQDKLLNPSRKTRR